MDDGERISRLSEGQKQCLRLVSQLKTSKEIARELAISPHTVDQRVKRAMRTLEVDSRADAARLLVERDRAGGLYQGLVYQRPDIEDSVSVPPQPDAEDGAEIADPAARHVAAGPEQEAPDPEGRSDLNVWQRLGLILAIAIGSALSFGAILAGLDALSRLS